MLTTKQIAEKYGKTDDEVKKALGTVGYTGRVSVVSKVSPEIESKLDAYFRQQAMASKKAAAKTVHHDRKIGSTQVVEKKRRTFTRPPKPEVAQPNKTDAAALTAAKPTPAAAAAAAVPPPAKPAAASSVPSVLPPQKAPVASAPATKAAKKTAAKKTTQAAVKKATKELPAKKTAKTQRKEKETVIKAGDGQKARQESKIKKQQAAPTELSIAESPAPIPAKPTPMAAKVSPMEELYQRQVEQQRERSAPPPKTSRATIRIDEGVVKERKKRRQQRKQITKRPPTNQHGFQKPVGPVVRELEIPDNISVSRLADDMAVKSGIIIRKLMGYGMTANTNTILDQDTAWIVVEEMGHKPVPAAPTKEVELEMLKQHDDKVPQEPRSPVVTIMGHVDHGKTSLLDYLRKTRVASGEAGGITQHIGAYQVETPHGNITFLDTPGHSLFSKMRARGAQITDVIVLVVAGDDGVKPQTEEAIAHAQAANVPIVVAINKMDKDGVDVERIKSELSGRGVTAEEWGGDALIVPISALNGDGIDNLLDAIHTQSDVLDLKAPRESPAQASVVEARVEKGRGVVVTLVVRAGILRTGDCFVCGTESGRVRTVYDSHGAMIKEAMPAMPIEIQGLSGMPEVGEDLFVVPDERRAREIADVRQEKDRIKRLGARAMMRPAAALLSNEEEKKELNVIVKADVGGSREALVAALTAISGKKAEIKVIHSGVGAPTESDINLAHASGALIVSFNARADTKSRKLAQSLGIKIMNGNVIYEIVEAAEKAVLDLLDAEREEKIIGTAKVAQVFSISKIGTVAGCRVADGLIRASAQARLLRDGAVVYEGGIGSLRHFKESADEVRMGEECGISITRFNDIKVDDVIEAFEVIETPPTL